MQAIILAGGEGTRLRPLTSNVPKPVITLVDRPFIAYMLEWLKSHGVDEVIMSCGFLADGVRVVMGDGLDYGVCLRYVEEPEPLGTAGAIKLAEQYLDERFFVLNGDVLTDIDLSAQLAQHEATDARMTLALIAVDDPSAYGLVTLEDNLSVHEFLEKPLPGQQVRTDLINAGAYIATRDVLRLIEPNIKTSWEHDIFPQLIGKGLYGYRADGYWLDIGTPERYLEATEDILSGRFAIGHGGQLTQISAQATTDGKLTPPLVIGADCVVAKGATVGPSVVLADHVEVEAGAVVERSVLLDGVRVGEGAVLRDCVVAARAQIGSGVQIGANVIVGEGVVLEPGRTVEAGEKVFARSI